jgi:hypothetical protein
MLTVLDVASRTVKIDDAKVHVWKLEGQVGWLNVSVYASFVVNGLQDVEL